MKAKVIATGEIIDVEPCINPNDPSSRYYYTEGYAKTYSPMELDFGTESHNMTIDHTLQEKRLKIATAILAGIEVNSGNSPEADCKLALDFAEELLKQEKGRGHLIL